jgi:cyclic pyranopterin phosphate synthase
VKDAFGRTIDYARISVTDRCGLKCLYCAPGTKQSHFSHSDLLSFEQLHRLVGALQDIGITKFRFTGGEPLLREGIFDFFDQVNLPGFYLTTGLAVDGRDIERLNRCRLQGINISLDTLDPGKYRWITRGGDISVVLHNIKKIHAGNIKLNTVLIKGFNENEVDDIIRYALSIGAVPRFIEMMNFVNEECNGIRYARLAPVIQRLVQEGVIVPPPHPDERSAAKYYVLKGQRGKVGFIMTVSEPFCRTCSRFRVKANGDVKLCLFGGVAGNVKKFLAGTCPEMELRAYLEGLIAKKPAAPMQDRPDDTMMSIGG